MRIGIIGTGNVGMSLATGFALAGHEVVLGTRDPDKQAIGEWLAQAGPSATVTSDDAAARQAEVVVLAVPGRLLPELVASIGAETFSGKVVIDPTNPVVYSDRGPEAAFGEDSSALEYLTDALPGAGVVKAFNQVQAPQMLDPERSEVTVMRICGDDAEAKETVTALLETFGWRVRDLGGAPKARKLEEGALDWMRRRYREQHPDTTESR